MSPVLQGALLPGAEPFDADGGPVGVLLCHGFTGSPQTLRPWAEYLAEAGLTVSLPRLPGHGTSWQDLARTTWREWYAEAEAAFGTLTARCEQVFVFGLSLGGCLALRLAETRG
ncbi:MAG: alpha/beta fold hydrolase, partial [Streptosporangiaceae bacterium]|nr:alpha/beta fold hydrolase [Streptosporangiaceae bacterium]